jgi:hypothetical protein
MAIGLECCGASMLRRLLNVLFGLTLLVLVAIGTVELAKAGLRLYEENSRREFAKRSPIAAGLPNRFSDGEVMFRRRVFERFPLGSSASELISGLEGQGFARNVRLTGKLNELVLRPGPGIGFPCTLEWSVAWEAANGLLTSLKTRYGGAPCL